MAVEGTISQTLFSTGSSYTTTAKNIEGKTNSERYTKSDLWASDDGTKFTYVVTFKYGTLVSGDFFNFIDNNDVYIGGTTNFDVIGARNPALVITNGTGLHYQGICADIRSIVSDGDWATLFVSVDYSGSGVPPVVEMWLQKVGETTAYDITPSAYLYNNDNGPQTMLFSSATADCGYSTHRSAGVDFCLAEIYMDGPDVAVDWSDSDERDKYLDANGYPKGLGATGSDLTGSQPKIYAADGDLSNNVGSEGNFTETGTISDCSTSPTDGASGGSPYTQSMVCLNLGIDRSGIIDQTLPVIAQSITATYDPKDVTSTASQDLFPITQTAAGLVVTGTFFFASIGQTLPSISQALTGTWEVGTDTGSIAQTLPLITQTASAIVWTLGTIDQQLSKVTTSGDFSFFAGTTKGPAAQILQPVAQSLAATYEAGLTTGIVTQTINGVVSTLSGTHQKGHFGSVTQSIPFLTSTLAVTNTASDRIGNALQALQSISQSLSGNYGAGVSIGEIPRQQLPFLSQVLVGETTHAAIEQTLPVLSQTLAGTHFHAVYSATLSQTLPTVTQVLTGKAPRTGQISMTLPPLVQGLTGVAKVAEFVALGAQSLGSIQQAALGTFTIPNVTGSISQTLSSLEQSGYAIMVRAFSATSLIWEPLEEELIWEQPEIKVLYTAPLPDNVLVDRNGDPIVDRDGNYIIVGH